MVVGSLGIVIIVISNDIFLEIVSHSHIVTGVGYRSHFHTVSCSFGFWQKESGKLLAAGIWGQISANNSKALNINSLQPTAVYVEAEFGGKLSKCLEDSCSFFTKPVIFGWKLQITEAHS